MYHCWQLAIANRGEQWLDTKQNNYNNNTIKILSRINCYRTIHSNKLNTKYKVNNYNYNIITILNRIYHYYKPYRAAAFPAIKSYKRVTDQVTRSGIYNHAEITYKTNISVNRPVHDYNSYIANIGRYCIQEKISKQLVARVFSLGVFRNLPVQHSGLPMVSHSGSM